MSDEWKQNLRDYQINYQKKYYGAKKLNNNDNKIINNDNKIIDDSDNDFYSISIIIKLKNIFPIKDINSILKINKKVCSHCALSIYYTWKNMKSSYKNNKFKISAPTWSDEFELPDGSFSISDIQNYFEYILKKHSESVDNPTIKIYVNEIENRVTFKIKK